MPVTYTSRTGKTYYLHVGPKRGGGVQHFFSTRSAGSLAERLPEGFEVYESVNGQVYLRRQRPKLIHDDELNCIARGVEKPRAGRRYKIEVHGDILTIHASSADFGWLERFGYRSPNASMRPWQSVSPLTNQSLVSSLWTGTAAVRTRTILFSRQRGRLDFYWAGGTHRKTRRKIS